MNNPVATLRIAIDGSDAALVKFLHFPEDNKKAGSIRSPLFRDYPTLKKLVTTTSYVRRVRRI
jgi:hypothetical protein